MKDIKVGDLIRIIEYYETIPMESSKSEEEKAIDSLRELLNVIEKDVQGKLCESDKQDISTHKDTWMSSIEVLRNYIVREV